MTNTSDTWSEWLVRTNDVEQLWKLQPTFFISQAVYLFAGLVTFIHALMKGGRWPYFWLGTVLHGIYADNFWHFVFPEYDNFWHSQTPVMFLGGRLPLHIIFLYPAFIYHAAYAVSRLRLPMYAEGCAVGLVTILIDLPYDIVAVKFVHWTWHDTDPNIFDRHYWVPLNSYYFHAAFAASFFYLFHASRSWLGPEEPVMQWKSAGIIYELMSLCISTVLGMPGGVLMFVGIYHPLHDMYEIPTSVALFLLTAVFAAYTIHGLFSKTGKIKAKDARLWIMDYIMFVQLAIHFIIYLVFVVWFEPGDEVSTGLHEPVGPCNEAASLITLFGQRLPKRKYFCPEDYDERYFDFHCVDQKPTNGTTWYTICGTPFENRAEYIVIISAIILLAGSVFYNLYFKTHEATVSICKIKTN